MSSDATLDAYQRSASRTINPALDDAHRLLDAAAGMAEESGEVLGLVRKHVMQQRPLDREALVKELGDVLWCVAIVSATIGVSLSEVASVNEEKLRARYPDGFGSTRSSRT